MSVFVNLWNAGTNLTDQAFDEAKDKAIEALLNVINRAIPVLDDVIPTVDIDFFESLSSLLPISDIDLKKVSISREMTQREEEALARRRAQEEAEAQRDLGIPASERVGSAGGTVVDPTQTAKKYLQFSSPPFIQADEIEKDIKFYRGTHIAITLFISGISMTIEVLTLGQVDKIVEGLMVIYNLKIGRASCRERV